MNRAFVIRIIGFLLTISFLFFLIYHGFRLHDKKNYQIKMAGTFMLIDQEDLLRRINDLIEISEKRQLFLNQIEKILEAEPYIQSSIVRYIWPNEIIIDVQEIYPQIIIRNHGFLTSKCKVIKYNNVNFENVYLFDLENIDLNPFFCQKAIQIQPYLVSKIDLVTLLSNGDYRLLIDGFEYVITDDLDRMFAKIWRTHYGLLKNNFINPLIVDLRYSSGLSIQPTVKLPML